MIKCLIWDLDETLWHGTLSDNERVKLRENIKPMLDELTARGIISSIASRNDENSAMEKLRQFGLRDYFVFPKCSWDSKVTSIKLILEQTNLSSEHVAFIDDNPFERFEVQSYFPKMLTIDSAEITNLLARPEFVPSYSSLFTPNRIQTYKTLEKRKSAEQGWGGSRQEFLKSCEMTMLLRLAENDDFERIVELNQRANQFNTSLERMDVSDFESLLKQKSNKVIVAELKDIFGDYGFIGYLLVGGKSPVQIHSFIVSCRVEGRGIAAGFLIHALRTFVQDDYEIEMLVNMATDRNRQMRILLHSLGFKKKDEQTLFIPTIHGLPEIPNWIRFVSANDF
ncbi:hypothetical protein BC351_39070 [Paenibacillus ferrarius]|uniref:N-acetyltransferase domain-containing protein n=1 Tax=Paenibacillus ferrarius TaxID=1469647 RepID=A0A1V4HAD4_9BACL|nr:HAD-IIIC family phosphatase [Paenibacillus ferrarius]OPH47992.1 hypothetical protein BC351_39070 [Paenibacillus ferrarius]